MNSKLISKKLTVGSLLKMMTCFLEKETTIFLLFSIKVYFPEIGGVLKVLLKLCMLLLERSKAERKSFVQV